jgi:23S rRNA (guanosine2251-2'-O)-methyltransferase
MMTKRKHPSSRNPDNRGKNPNKKRSGTSGDGRGPSRNQNRKPKFETVTKSAARLGRSGTMEAGAIWLFGHHAVEAALANPRRDVRRILVTSDEQTIDQSRREKSVQVEKTPKAELDRLLPPGAVHQGIACQVGALQQPRLETLLALHADDVKATILVLDQVTDPRNVGAILRSAAAFDAIAVVMTERHAPPETGTLAKAASGALEIVPLVQVTNLARALETLAVASYWRIGLDGNTTENIADARPDSRRALVLGAEGKGLRRLSSENCDQLVRLPISSKVESLNVSNAAAIALFALNQS